MSTIGVNIQFSDEISPWKLNITKSHRTGRCSIGGILVYI